MFRRYIPVIVVIALIAAAFVVRFGIGGNEDTWLCQNGLWTRHGNPASPMPTEGCGTAVQTEARVSLAGHLVKNNPGLVPDTWYLISEKPGAPAITTALSFNTSSICTLSGSVGVCDPNDLVQGEWASLNGSEAGSGTVIVSSLIDTSSSQALSRCPEYVNCMPGPDVTRTCVIPPGCEGVTQKAY